MASKNNSHETEFSGIREKVDISMVEAVPIKPQHVQNAAETQFQSKYNLRQSLAWDSAFFSSPGVLDPEELFEALNFRDVDGESEMTGCKGLKQLPFENTEDGATGSLDRSIRKSLAWDSSFFTSPGVLDEEELCIVNRGFRRSGTLFGIEEETWRSADSSSTAVSDSYSLGSLDIGFFDDITTSVHNEPSSNLSTSACKPKRGGRMQSGRSKLASAESNSSSHPRSKTAASIGSSNLLYSHRPATASGSSRKQLTSPLPKVSKGTKPVTGKRGIATPAAEKRMTLPTKASLSSSFDFVQCSKLSSKIDSSVSPVDRRSCARLSCPPSHIPDRHLPNSSRITADSRPHHAALASASRTTPLRHSSMSKSKLNKSMDTTGPSTTPTSSSRASPVNPVDRRPLPSSSTTSKQRTNKRPSASPGTSPSRGISFESDASQTSNPKSQNSHCRFGNELHEKDFIIIPSITKISGVSPVAENVPRDSRSSGLRVPTPKIGFFDAEDSVASASKRVPKSRSGSQISPSMVNFSIAKVIGAASSKSVEKICPRKKRQLLEGNNIAKALSPEEAVVMINEDNKENVVGFAYQVNELSRNMEAVGF